MAILASMATYEYRVTEAADGTFPVELWSSQGDRSQLIYKTRGFQTRELAEAWIVPVEDRSGDPPSPRSRVIISSREAPPSIHSPDIELRIIEQRKVHLPAHRRATSAWSSSRLGGLQEKAPPKRG